MRSFVELICAFHINVCYTINKAGKNYDNTTFEKYERNMKSRWLLSERMCYDDADKISNGN